jgi:hypothetical protein
MWQGFIIRFAAVLDSYIVISQPKGELLIGKCMAKPIVICEEPNQPSPICCNILIARENLNEGDVSIRQLVRTSISGGAGAPMLKEIFAFILPTAGGK